MAVATKARTKTSTRTKAATKLITKSVARSAKTSASTAKRGGKIVRVMLIAHNMKFSESTLTVPASARVKMTFENRDYSVAHNFALYQDSSAAKSIFVGQVISGPATVDYTFTAPAKPGDYFFRCDVHPVIMQGTFRVLWPAKNK